jgi:hypothetical protein
MLRPLLVSAAVAAGLALTTRPAPAQMHHDMPEPPAGSCDLCAPQLSLDGAALFRADAALPSAGSPKTTALVRARLEVGSFVPHVGLFSQMEFTPSDGPTPAIQFGLALWAMRRQSPLNLSAGIGFTDYREGVGETRPGAFVMHGWGQLRLQYRTPVHDVTLYAQAGAPLISGGRASYQLGGSHPLAPYKLHLP